MTPLSIRITPSRLPPHSYEWHFSSNADASTFPWPFILLLNAQYLTLSEPPLACIFCSEFFHLSTLYRVQHCFWVCIIFSHASIHILTLRLLFYHFVHDLDNCLITYFILLQDSLIPLLCNLSHLVQISIIIHISSYLTLHLSLYSFVQVLDNCSVTIT